MNRKIYSTLVKAAENLTPIELCQAPELPTLIALDANLLATINLFKFQSPFLGCSGSESGDMMIETEGHIADSICILANALRGNLSAYYAAVQESFDENNEGNDHEVEF